MNAEYRNRAYTVVPYNLQWPKEFEKTASRIKEIFGDDAIDIEHVGSTSVPGMEGKPTIDILVTVGNLVSAETHIPEMEQNGFKYSGQFVMADSRLFRIMKGNAVLANIHVFPKNHQHVQEMLALRDYLRTHEAETKAYSEMKRDLYEKYRNDYASYRKYKDEYMNALKTRIE